MEKEKRLEIIKQLIQTRTIGSQQELMDALEEIHIQTTQSTLSRDLHDLKVQKGMSGNGKSVYRLSSQPQVQLSSLEKQMFSSQESGFKSLRFSGNMGVIHTKAGYAGSIAHEIDSAMIPSILGTIAGYDTILLILEEGVAHKDVKVALARILNV